MTTTMVIPIQLGPSFLNQFDRKERHLLRICSDYEESSSRLIARYILSTTNCFAYPVEDPRLIMVLGKPGRSIQAIPKTLGLMVEFLSHAECAVIGASPQSCVMFLIYNHLLSKLCYQAIQVDDCSPTRLPSLLITATEDKGHIMDSIFLHSCILNSKGEGRLIIEMHTYRKINSPLFTVADNIFEDDENDDSEQNEIMTRLTRTRPQTLLTTGENVTAEEDLIFFPNSKSDNRLLTHFDISGQAKGYRLFIPSTSDNYMLYWKLGWGISLNPATSWSLTLVKSDSEERIVPIEALCKLCVETERRDVENRNETIFNMVSQHLHDCPFLHWTGPISKETQGSMSKEKAVPRLVRASSMKS